MGCSVALANCSSEDEEVQGAHEILADPVEAQAASAASEIAITSCLSSYDTDVTTVRSFIQNNCGGITRCGGIDNFNHADVFIGGNYCDCYSKLFANRASGAFSRVQVIYHEPGGCNDKHIHLQKRNLCGTMHYDLDEGGGTNCFDDEPTSKWDRWTGGGICPTLQHDSRIGACDP